MRWQRSKMLRTKCSYIYYVSSLASGKLRAAQRCECFCLDRALNFLDLAHKGGDISRTVHAITKHTHSVSIRAIAELENAQRNVTKRIPIENSDVKKVDRCLSLALNHHCVFWCVNIIINTCVGELYPHHLKCHQIRNAG